MALDDMAPSTCKVPLFTIVVPVYGLEPVSVNVAAPFFTTFKGPVVPVPEPSYSEKVSVIVPPKVVGLFSAMVNVAGPRVKLAPVFKLPFAITAAPPPADDRSDIEAL